jgi:murein DD-endopeptidase MepM/ murein hydrolase activator NlpD
MIRARAILALVLAGAPLCGYTPEPVRSLNLPGTPLEFFFRSLQPGEIILAKLREDPSVKKAVVRVFDQTRCLAASPSAPPAFALLGIDVGVKARAYDLEISIERTDGTAERTSRDLVIEPKDFPKRHFNVPANMLVPPDPEQERVRREAEIVADILGSVSPVWLGDGPFRLPLPDRDPYPNFGQQRIYNATTTAVHNGVDIAAPWGAPARASNAGRVVLASRLYLSGNTVIIDHGLGVFTFYGHFSKLLVKRGDFVKKGQIIANVGNTGRSTGPHVHWSARVLNARVDPCALLSLPLD